uniref:Ribonuclease A-domain domain-containing protein n=2 Tax=Anolis carolinensis TaxID=28377 RepID=A0A803SVH8_ANOCA
MDNDLVLQGWLKRLIFLFMKYIMSFKVCLLLSFLVATALFQGSEGTSYSDFLKRHLDNPKSDYQNDETYCNLMMSRRNLNCQQGNTFIHAIEQQLVDICNSTGKVLDGNQTSKTLFPITVCTLQNGSNKLSCKYKGETKIKKIRVTCQKGLPVHYIAHT